MPCCSVSRSRISFCLPCHVRDSRSIWFIFISASSHPDCRARTATGPRDARRPRPPRRTATGHTTGQRAPPVGAAPSPRPRAKPRADSRARMARTKGGRDPTRGPHAHRATAHPIQSPPALRAVRASSRAAASIAADAAENATPSPPASCHRSTTRLRLPSRLRDTCRRQRAHRHGARFRSHTPPDPRGPCRTLTLYDCTTDRHTQHRHTALRSQRQRRHRGA